PKICIWASLKPGRTDPPRASTTWVSGPEKASTSASEPTARIRLAPIAMASARGRASSIVSTRALRMIKLASVCIAYPSRCSERPAAERAEEGEHVLIVLVAQRIGLRRQFDDHRFRARIDIKPLAMDADGAECAVGFARLI